MKDILLLNGISIFLLYMSIATLFGNMAEKTWQARKKGVFSRRFTNDANHDEYIFMQKLAACIAIPFVIFFWIGGMKDINKKSASSNEIKASVIIPSATNSDHVAPLR